MILDMLTYSTYQSHSTRTHLAYKLSMNCMTCPWYWTCSPIPLVSVIPPGVMVLEHAGAQHEVELNLVPALRSFLL